MLRTAAWICLVTGVLAAAAVAGWPGSGLLLITLLTSELLYSGAAAWRLGTVGLRITPQPARPGHPLDIAVELTPTRQLSVSRILLGLKAHSTSAGTVTTLLNRTYELCNETTIERGSSWKRAMQLELPETIPPSGPGADGQIVWLVELEVSVPGWPTFFEVQPLRVAPAGSSPGPERTSTHSTVTVRKLLPAPGCLLLIHLPLMCLFLLLAAGSPSTIWSAVSGNPPSATATIAPDAPVAHGAYVRLRLHDHPGATEPITVTGSAAGKPFEKRLEASYPETGQPRAVGRVARLSAQSSGARTVTLVAANRPSSPRVVSGELALVPLRQGLWPLIWFTASFVLGAGFWICLISWIWRLKRSGPAARPYLRGGPAMLGFLLYIAAMAGLAYWLEPFPWRWMW